MIDPASSDINSYCGDSKEIKALEPVSAPTNPGTPSNSVAAHTPGPWLSIGTTPREQIIREENGEVIAFIPHNCPRREYEANARLIAAAPDLLLALSWLSALVSKPTAEQLADYNDQMDLCLGAARAAIAKATGAPNV